MWRDIECGILNPNTVGRYLFASHVRNLARGALLDGNVISIGGREIHCGPWGCNIKWNPMFLRQYRDRVGADLVGDIAIGGYAVGSDDDGADLALFHDGSGHVG